MRDRLRNGRMRNVRARSRSGGGGDVVAAPDAPRLHGGAVPSGHWAAAHLTTSAESNAPTKAPRRLGDIRSDEHRAAARIQQGGRWWSTAYRRSSATLSAGHDDVARIHAD